MPLVASKLEWEHDEEGISPPRRVKMGQHDKEGQAPSLSRPNWNGNTTRRGISLLAVSKWDNATRRGKPPPHRVRIGMETRRGGYILLAMSKWDNATRRGKPPPHRVRTEMETRRGGVYPSSPCRNRNNVTRRDLPLLVAFN